jgi:hypothetical protein
MNSRTVVGSIHAVIGNSRKVGRAFLGGFIKRNESDPKGVRIFKKALCPRYAVESISYTRGRLRSLVRSALSKMKKEKSNKFLD